MLKQIVTSVDDLTPDWFTMALADAGVSGGATVVDAEVERFGMGTIAGMARARLTYDVETDAPGSVLVKFPTDDQGTLGLAVAMGMYELEVRFYQDVAPMLGSMSVPRCFLAEHDAASGMFTLVLEDLSETTRAGDVLTAATADECALVLDQLIKFQAPLWDSIAVAELDWLADPRRTIRIFDAMPGGLDPFVARFGDKLRPEHVKLFETLLPQAGAWVRSWSAPTVLQHGDFRNDNILFATVPSAPPVTVVDFQTVRLGPPGLDAAYFIGSSLPTEQRRAVERDLVAGYHAGLLAEGVSGFDFDACWSAYREGAMYGVFLFVGMASQVESTERGDFVIVDQITRYADMAIDLEAPVAAGLA